jgi:uncharacterized membrane protein YfcA
MIEWNELSPWLLVLAPLVIIAAYTVFGLSGFGSTVVSVPILAHFLPVAYLVPLMALLDVVCAAVVGTKARDQVAKDELKRLAPFMFVGFVLGATVLIGLPDRYLKAALGIFATAIGIHSVINPVLHRTISAWWCIPAGIAGGAIATVFGAGGPIYATYMAGRSNDKGVIRATISTLISISAFTRAVVYAVSGLLLNMAILVGCIVLAPFVYLGLSIGQRIHTGLSQEQLRRVIGVIVFVTGVSLIIRAFFQS